MDLSSIDLSQIGKFGGEFPHDWFSLLRREAPVWRHPAVQKPGGIGIDAFWVVSTHAGVREVLFDAKTYSSAEGISIGPDPSGMAGTSLVMTDPPLQTRMRGLINKGFTPRMVRRLERNMRERTRRVLDAVAERGECEFVFDIAAELPVQMICDILGVPEEDKPLILEMTNRAATDETPPEELEATFAEIYLYGRPICETKRRDPQDDVLSLLVHAEVEGDDGRKHRLTGPQVEMFFAIMLVAGTETVRNAASGGLRALIENQDQLAKLVDDPSLLPSAVEEILRWTSPAAHFGRVATRDTELLGRHIRAEERVTVWFPSANRDAEVFRDPFRFDVSRRPNPHLAFGGGPHFCLGANLARMELSVLFDQLLQRFHGFEITDEVTRFQPDWTRPVYGGYKHMPLRFERG